MATQAMTMRVFVASPGDVEQERDALARVLTDVNLALESLAPHHPVVLQLVRWETHVHPDFGRPQGVVNDQIHDYDVLVGIMWKRFGTPTGEAESGTEEEFRIAFDRWTATGMPRILFYFSEAAMPVKLSSAEVGQLQKVVAFREELTQQGLVKSYASAGEFPDVVRRDLIHLVGRILNGDDGTRGPSAPQVAAGMDLQVELVRPQITRLAEEYEHLRDTMSSGDRRTQAMEAVAARMRALAADVYPMLHELSRSPSPGQRLAAVSLLEVRPDSAYLEWVATRLQNGAEKPFLQYHATLALLQAVRELASSHRPALESAIAQASRWTAALDPSSDRARILSTARDELSRSSA